MEKLVLVLVFGFLILGVISSIQGNIIIIDKDVNILQQDINLTISGSARLYAGEYPIIVDNDANLIKLNTNDDFNNLYLTRDTNVFTSGVADCPADQYLYGFNSNGTVDCRDDIQSQKYVYIKALAQSEGNLSLSDATNWPASKAIINRVTVATTSTDWNLTLYPDANFNDSGLVGPMVVMRGADGNGSVLTEVYYIDDDNSMKVHLNWVSGSGSETADLFISGVELR